MNKKYFFKTMKRLNDEKGLALILSYLVLTVFFLLASGFAISTVNELNQANAHRYGTKAFWAAEAALNRFLQDTTLLDTTNPQTFEVPASSGNTVTLTKDDTDPDLRVVTAAATVNGVTRTLQMTFPSFPPGIFDNALTSGGNFNFSGFAGQLSVFGPVDVNGTYSESAGVNADFFDVNGNPTTIDTSINDPFLTTLAYPDENGNLTPDEFADFVKFYSKLTNDQDPDFTGEYTSDEILYINSDDTQYITPDADLDGVKLIFVEGSAPGQGDVEILFDPTWLPNQNITIVTTGTIRYTQPLQNPAANSQLNTVSWDNYIENSILWSAHSGVTFTHSTADLNSILALSSTEGLLVANNLIDLYEVIADKTFTYEDPVDSNGLVPPGFQGLVTFTPPGYQTTPSSWEEI